MSWTIAKYVIHLSRGDRQLLIDFRDLFDALGWQRSAQRLTKAPPGRRSGVKNLGLGVDCTYSAWEAVLTAETRETK